MIVPNHSHVFILCRRVKFLSLERCSLLTTRGLESVITSWSDLQSLEVVSCNKIKDEEITPALSELFSNLKELKWRPDNKSLLAVSLVGTGMGKKGRVFFKRVWSLIILVLHSLRCASPVVCSVRIDLSCSRSYWPTNGSKGRCSSIQQVSPLSWFVASQELCTPL